MTGEEYVDDLFALKATAGGTGRDGMLLALEDGEMAQMVARFEESPYEDPNTGEVLSGAEGLERYLQNKGIGVNHSSEHGWRLETGIDTSDGIYGTMNDGKSVADFEGAPDTTKDSTMRTIADISPNLPVDDDPFTDPPPKPEDVIKEIEDKYSTSQSGGDDGGDGSATDEDSGSTSNASEASTPGSSSAGGASSSADASALAAAYAAAGVVNPHIGTGSPLDPSTGVVSDLPLDTTGDDTTGDTIGDNDGATTGDTTGDTTGVTAGGTAPGQTGDNVSNVVDGTGTSTGDATTGTGDTGTATTGSGTGGDNTGSTGTGTGGSTGGRGTGSGMLGTAAGAVAGVLFGDGPGEGGGFGDGIGDGFGEGDGLGGGGKKDGMMSGTDHIPEWGELFDYTPIDVYTAEKLEPYRPALIQAKELMA